MRTPKIRSPNSSFISQTDAAADLGVSKVTLWRLIKAEEYPQPVEVPGSILKPVVRAEHEAYKAALMAARTNPAKKAG